MIEHLDNSVAACVSLPLEQRIRQLDESVWIEYPRAAQILEQLERLFHMPKKIRMPNVLIVGPTHNGKSTILERFIEKHPVSNNVMADSAIAPVICVSSPPTADECAFYDSILMNFSTPIRPRDHARNKRFQVITLLKSVGTKILIIDEIQDMLAGDSQKQHAMLKVVKHLGNALRIPIVAAGVESALNAIQIDPQVANRFHPIPLPRWRFDTDFRRLLASFERVIPLKKPSSLAGKAVSERLYFMSEGVLGELTSLLAKCAELAIRSEEESINLESLDKVEWIIPSERRRKAETAIR